VKRRSTRVGQADEASDASRSHGSPRHQLTEAIRGIPVHRTRNRLGSTSPASTPFERYPAVEPRHRGDKLVNSSRTMTRASVQEEPCRKPPCQAPSVSSAGSASR
jgi:hypothetical protein